MAAEIDASSLPLDDGTEYASMLETLVDVDPLAVGMYSLDLSADLVLTNLMLQDQSRVRTAQNSSGSRSASSDRRAAQPIDVPSDLHAAPTAEQRQRQDRLSNWLSRFYRRDLEDAARFVRYAWDVGARNGVDPYLIVAVMSIESSLDPMAVSDKGARGLMQVLVSAHEEKFDPFGGPVKAHNPLVSIEVGTRILKRMIELTGSVEGALKHYVGAKYFKSDGGYGAKVISMRERVWSAAMGYRIPTRPDVASAIERANNAQAAFTARTQTAER